MDSGKTWSNCSKGNPTTDTLSVEAVAYRNGYRYRCIVKSGSCKITSTSAILTVNSLALIEQPGDVSANVGDTVRFSVSASNSNAEYQWQYSMDGGKTWSNCSKGNPTTATLSVEAVAYRNGYMYRCIVKSGSSSLTSDAAKLTVNSAPQIIAQPESVTVKSKETANVSVTATGTGLTYTWYYKDKNASSFTKSGLAVGNTYSVEMTSARNGRQLYCVITDSSGNSVTTDTAVISMAS